MPIYRTRKGTSSYGHELGILQIDCDQPLVPGDVGNATTWPFTVLFQPMKGCTIDRLIHKNDASLIAEVREAAKKLESYGVRAITSNCGFMIQFQDQLAAEASVPVFLSPLLQLPYILRSLGGKRPVGVMTASTSGLSREILALAHVGPDDPTPVYGVDQYPEFNDTFMHDSGVVDTDAVERACVDLAKRMVSDHPDMGAILLECAVLPPYANAMQKATGLPVYDFVTMAEQFIAGYHRPRYEGHY
jgi:hypothetical protein